MNFLNVADNRPVVEYLVNTLTQHLRQGERVTWLLTGGSGIAIEAEVSQKLAGEDLSKLTVMLTDERFGSVGHDDSNWKQMDDQGFMLENARQIPVLTGKDMPETINDFAVALQDVLTKADYKIGLFGMGADGHTAGILPESPAVYAEEMAAGYDAGNFRRITMTFKAIKMLDEAVLAAFGNEKLPALKSLQQEDLALAKQPVQILKQLPKLTVFNNQIGDVS